MLLFTSQYLLLAFSATPLLPSPPSQSSPLIQNFNPSSKSSSVPRSAVAQMTAADSDDCEGGDCDVNEQDERDVLAARIEQVRTHSGTTLCKAVALRETLVPGQRLRMTAPPQLVELFTSSTMPIVLISLQANGRHSMRGVEATLEGPPAYRPVVPGIHPEGTADIVIAAGRVCELAGAVQGAGLSVTRPCRVRWLYLDAGFSKEAPPPASIVERSEAIGVRVSDWMDLVRRACRERTPNHLQTVLADLGSMPPPERPEARALWVAGLLNPSPPLGASSSKKVAVFGETVAPEIRPSALEAGSVEARLSTIEAGLAESFRRLRKMVAADDAEYKIPVEKKRE